LPLKTALNNHLSPLIKPQNDLIILVYPNKKTVLAMFDAIARFGRYH
jgi:hypothetical protein